MERWKMASQLTPVTDPKILEQLNAPDDSSVVTDPALLAQLNAPVDQNAAMNQSSDLGAFARSAVATPVNMLLNLGRLFTDPLTDPNITKAVYQSRGAVAPVSKPFTASDFLPASVSPTFADQYHPTSQLLGSLLGGGALAYATGGSALEGGAPEAAEAFAPSLLSKMASGAKSGFLQGYGYTDGSLGQRLGNAGIGFGLGAFLPAALKGATSFGKGVVNTGRDLASWMKANPQALQQAVDETGATNAAQQQAIAEANANVKMLGGTADPTTTAAKINFNKNEIDKLQQRMASIPGSANDDEVAQMFPGMDPATRLAQSENMETRAQSNLDESNNAQAQQLGVGQNFAVRLGTALKNAIKNIRDSFKPRYQQHEEDLTGLKVTNPMSSASDATQSTVQDMLDSLPSNYADENGDLIEALQSQDNKPSQISGKQLLQLNRSANSAYNSAIGKGNAYGVGSDVQAAWRAKAANIKKLVDSSRSIMEDELPPDTLADYDQTQADYGKQVMPFYRNGAFQMIDKEGKVPNNFIDNTSGNQDHQIIMQKLIQSDPELTRLALGQKYASNPQDLLNWNEAAEPYIQAHQPTSDLLENQKNAVDNLNNAQNVVQKVKEVDPIFRAKTQLDQLEQAHNQRMNEITKGEMTAKKAAQAAAEQNAYKSKRNWLIAKASGFAGFGLLYYMAHRELWDMFSK